MHRACYRPRSQEPIRPGEQVPDRPPRQVGQPPATEVLGLVVQNVAALGEGREVRGLVVLRVVITVSRSEDDAGGAGPLDQAVRRWQASHFPAVPITPALGLSVPPAAIADEMQHHALMRPAAALALALGMAEAD